MHNQLHQDSLKLEKKWVTQNPWFRLATTYVGICATDTYLMLNYHKIIYTSKTAVEDMETKVSIQQFAGILANQLIQYASKLGAGHASRFLPEDEEPFIVRVPQEETELSSPTLMSTIGLTTEKNVLHSSMDANGIVHF